MVLPRVELTLNEEKLEAKKEWRTGIGEGGRPALLRASDGRLLNEIEESQARPRISTPQGL